VWDTRASGAHRGVTAPPGGAGGGAPPPKAPKGDA
jgi:hypothetical protein